MINNSKSFASLFSPFIIIYPLYLNCISTFSRCYIIFSHKINNAFRLAIPSFTYHSISKRLFDVESKEGFTSGAPLDGFNSLFKFRFHSLFNKRLVLITDKTKIYKSIDIYNLSVKKDESYVTKLAIVHNCRCTTISIDESEGTITDMRGFKKPNDVPEEFMMNSGKDRIVFSDKHPYFKVAKDDKKFAKENFSLPIPKVEKPVAVEPIVKGFIPAKNIKEAEERIRNLGVKSVNIKGLEKGDLFNSVLEAVEAEHKINPLALDELITVNQKNNRNASYVVRGDQVTKKITRRSITINIKNLDKFNFKELKSYEDLILEQKTRLTELIEKESAGGYTENMKQFLISAVEKNIKDFESKIADGLKTKWWSVSSMEQTQYGALKSTMTHEIGHHRHDFLFNEKVSYSRATPITDYSKTDEFEYFAEWYTTYRKKDGTIIPEDLLTMFEKVDYGK